MEINDYIQSGLIESYVLGLTDAEETAQVESMRMSHPQIEDAISSFSLALEQKALETAVTPPPELKNKIFAELFKDRSSDQIPLFNSQDKKEQEIRYIPHIGRWKMLAAASVILLIVSAALNFYLYRQYNGKSEAYQALLSERETLQANNQVYQTQLKEWQSAALMMADTTMATIKMHNPKGVNEAATVFWNTKNKDVYVMVNKLPDPSPGKQYQLWAMVDGKPVDAGVLDASCTSVCKMKNIPKAQAFAITLEKEGGNPTPNLKALHVMGSI